MKASLFILLFVFQTSHLFSQFNFVISGKTNFVKDGKAVLYAHPDFSFTKKNDTVKITDYSFTFTGIIKYPEQRRIEILETRQLTEPFFISIGSQTLNINNSVGSHDVLDFGSGITMKGSPINDEYFNDYLSAFTEVNKKRGAYFTFLNQCDSISDSGMHKSCVVNLDSMRVHLKLMRDSILFNYSFHSPDSKIIPWLIYDAIFYHGYNDLYQQSFEKSKGNMPDNMRLYLDSALKKSKLTAVGNIFPLAGYIDSHFSKHYLLNNKYTLVDFWFSRCSPCIAQFKLLKDVYLKNKEKGFDMVAISIDKQNDLPVYEKILSQNAYPWKQILDTGGIKTNQINIKKFPSNFLLDQQGKIIAIDINPFVLEKFLEQNISH